MAQPARHGEKSRKTLPAGDPKFGPRARPIQIDPALMEQFGRTMRENFTTGSVPFRRDVRPTDVTAWPLEIGEARRAAALIGIL